MPLTIVRNDITRLNVDAIVNAANTALQMGGGVCGAIFQTAGAGRLQAACDLLAPIQTGEAVITEGFDLPAKYIIHAAGPVYRDGRQGEDVLLRACYNNALELAVSVGCESIAFPLISSGLFGYPKAEALSIATEAIRAFISEHDIDVYLVVFDKKAFEVGEALLGEVRSYIDEHYVGESRYRHRGLLDVERRSLFEADMVRAPMPMRETAYVADEDAFEESADLDDHEPKAQEYAVHAGRVQGERATMLRGIPTFLREVRESPPRAAVAKAAPASAAPAGAAPASASLDDIVGNLDEPFSTTLLRLIDKKGRKDPEVYRRANIDRRLFSKIRNNENYAPTKTTVLAFAVALELTLDQTVDLLARAGFALSPSRKFDVIVEFFIQSKRYDIFEINNVLFSYDQPLLGG